MQRVKCIVSYDGTLFSGYQVQVDKRTVQREIEKVLATMHKRDVKVTASGRTDAGVHAYGQVIHFDTSLTMPPENWVKALNTMLPDDIAIVSAEYVSSSFHARYGAKGKEYRYVIDLSPIRDPLKRNYTFHYPYPIDKERIEEAIPYLLGTHDFTSFSSARTDVVDKVRTIYRIDCKQEGTELTLCFSGNGFLYNMVRILTGTLIEIGAGRREPEDMKEIIASHNRAAAGKTAPPQGLYLWEVYY
ncbi:MULTISPECIES: tRNA pseudouridine(38-40) synthase TruA [Bacillus]|uniref:tRNA pseudouridine(38-40) synthase TruA n=1 Tax=Bacillus TaxID=1386 RepID=UPI0003073DCA|nr:MULTISPECIES: tRNA pseudouridine(38-40) synthase TruA [Bacillus]